MYLNPIGFILGENASPWPKMAGSDHAKSRRKKNAVARDLCKMCALHVHVRTCIKPHTNSIYKAIGTNFTAYDVKMVSAHFATNRTEKI